MRAAIIAAITAAAVSASAATAATRLLTGRDIRDGTIATRDLMRGSVTPDRLSASVRTLMRAGSHGLNAQVVVADVALRDGTTTGGVSCPDGKFAVGGGAMLDTPDVPVDVDHAGPAAPMPILAGSAPRPDGGGWVASVRADGVSGGSFSVYAVCVAA